MLAEPEVTEWSVSAKKLGVFYCKIFDRWVTRDVGKAYVQLFDQTLGKWVGAPGGSCIHAETCGRARAKDGESGLSYLCPAYYQFFTHAAPAMQTMAELYRSGRPPAEIMRMKQPRRRG